VSKEYYRGDCVKVERSERLQNLVYDVLEDRFGITKEMWDVIQELKGDRNRTYHRHGNCLSVAKELCAMLETVDIGTTEEDALQMVIKAITMGDQYTFYWTAPHS
jgi:hypothetical protein